MMNAQLVTRIDTLLRSGKELAHEGGSEFSGYNAKKQGKYLLWRKNCLDALDELKELGTPFTARIADDENGLYFYHSSVQHILTVMEEARTAARTAVDEAEARAKAEAAAREEEAREKARREAEELERAKREEEERKEAERLEQVRREEEARKEAERVELARHEEAARKEAEERERIRLEESAREQEARESARKQVEALEAERKREKADAAAGEKTMAQTRAESESPASSQTAAAAAAPAPAQTTGSKPKLLVYSLSNHVMLKQVLRFFDELSLEYSVITHTDGKWTALHALDAGQPYYAVFLLSDRYHGQELMALGYLAGSSPSVRLCAIHAHTLMLGELLPGVSKNEFTVSFDEIKPNLTTELKAAGLLTA